VEWQWSFDPSVGREGALERGVRAEMSGKRPPTFRRANSGPLRRAFPQITAYSPRQSISQQALQHPTSALYYFPPKMSSCRRKSDRGATPAPRAPRREIDELPHRASHMETLR